MAGYNFQTMSSPPTTGPSLGTVATWGAAGANLVGGVFNYQSAMAQVGQYKLQAKAYKEEADLIRANGLWTATYIRSEGDKLKGTQLATYAKAGVTLEGTPLDVLSETARQVELDALMAKYQSQIQERKALQNAEMASSAASAQKKAGQLGLFGKIAGSAVGFAAAGPVGALVGGSLF